MVDYYHYNDYDDDNDDDHDHNVGYDDDEKGQEAVMNFDQYRGLKLGQEPACQKQQLSANPRWGL